MLSVRILRGPLISTFSRFPLRAFPPLLVTRLGDVLLLRRAEVGESCLTDRPDLVVLPVPSLVLWAIGGGVEGDDCVECKDYKH
jgi:hypothetical protein